MKYPFNIKNQINTPDIPNFDKENLNLSEKEFKQSYAYKKYVEPLEKQHKSEKKNNVLNWIKQHIFDILQAITSLVAIALSIIAIMK